jgi:phosphate transport system substrate-binding protein
MRPIAALAFAAALTSSLMLPAAAQEIAGTAAVTGAGSTFAYPLISRWSKAYQHWVAGGGDFPVANGGLDDPPAGPVLDYEPVGSLAGMMRVTDGAVDFGATEMPLKSVDLRKLRLVQFPMVIGGIVAVVNLDGVGPGQIKLTGPLIADIFLGKIKSWSDPAIKALNPELQFPDAGIVVVHRSDGSGTTFSFTNYLAKVSPEWREKVGSDLIVPWPLGEGAKGNKGVAEKVAATKNAIGYVEYAQALQSKLSFAAIQNRNGTFMKPDAASFQAAAADAAWDQGSDFNLLLTDASGKDAYPIVAPVFVLMRDQAAPIRTRAALNLFEWAFDRGAGEASTLGYVPLPKPLVAQIKDYWAKNLLPDS